MKRKLAIVIVAIMVLAVVTPTVMGSYFIDTNPATDITATSATLNGDRKSGKAYNCPNYVWFEWGTTTSYGNETVKKTVPIGAFNETITGLTPGTTYHYRAVIDVCQYKSYGDDMTFTTEATSAPVPEFATIAIPAVAILGLFLFYNHRKRKEE